MCGISFILDKRFILDEQPIRQMNQYLKHRGPDSGNIAYHTYNEHQYFLGANRLMIIDQDEYSNQPFYDDENSAILIFNGEIYNFFDLKNQLLDHSIKFKTQSDTEVLFYWLKIFGKSRLQELEGMFSFVFLNCEEHTILMARDRFGMKPLYYFHDDRYFIASSEAKGILASGLVNKNLNTDAVYHYLAFRYSNKPQTFYTDIFELSPSKYLSIDAEGSINIDSYHQFSINNSQQTVSVNSVGKLIRESFLKHLYSKSKIGLMLSGGVDSTLLLALADEERINIPTFSVVNDKKDRKSGTNDYKYADWIAKRFGADHYKIEVNSDLLVGFIEWVSIIDQPVADSGAWMTYLLCDHAKDWGIKVLLSGAGADELFAGYNRHWAFCQYLKYKKYLIPLSRLYNSMSKVIPGRILEHELRHLNVFFRSIHPNSRNTYYNFLKAPFRELNKNHQVGKLKGTIDDPFKWCLQHDLNNYLVHDVLSISDQMSMQHGMEIRMPYLDNALSSYLMSVDSNSLIKGGRKWVLKSLLKKYEVDKVINRSKEGFGMPLAAMFRNIEDFGIWDLFQKENSIIFNFIDQEFFNKLLKDHKKGKADNSQALWSVLLLGHWLKKEFE